MPRFPEILNTSEAAEYLRAHVETVRRLARRGAITSFKVGKDWRFRREDLRAFAASIRNVPVQPRTTEPSELNRKLRAEVRERRRIEASLRESEARLRESENRLLLIANNLPVGMIYQIVRTSDGNRRFTFLSGAVERLHGCTPDEAMADASRIYGTVIEDDRDRVLAEEEQALETFSVFQTEVRIRRPFGDIGWSFFASKPRWMDDGSTCWDGLEIDITERKRAEGELRASEERYRHLSLHDGLTGLFNRSAFTEHLIVVERDFALYAPVSILVLDVNRLKLINDTMGHSMGDSLLVTAAEAISRILPSGSCLFRTGGDEFCVVALHTSLAEAEAMKDRIMESASLAEHGPAGLGWGFSIGVACSDEHPGMNVFEIFQCADDDMYHDKLIRNGSSMSHIETLVAALDAHDFGSQGHLERVARISEAMADRLRLPEAERKNLVLLARLHDLGKVGVHGQILHKRSVLTAQERSAIRAHVEIGHRIAARSHDLARIARLILHHHENWDGSGYPLGLRGDAIPLECRILRIADAFDAMTSDRPYRSPLSFDDSMKEIREQSGVQFDPHLVNVFLDLFRDNDSAARVLAGAEFPV